MIGRLRIRELPLPIGIIIPERFGGGADLTVQRPDRDGFDHLGHLVGRFQLVEAIAMCRNNEVGAARRPVIESDTVLSQLSAIEVARTETIASAVLSLQTSGEGFFEITREVASFLERVRARDGALLLFLQHTSASLVIQENADPDVRADLVTALTRLAPADAGWVHETEGPDDMPAHIKSMLNGVCLHVPVSGGRLGLGTWQGIYVAEHRAAPHRREVVLQFVGSCAQS